MKSDDKIFKVAFVGNPNCGKTTLFNGFTGSNYKTANIPGVTVDKKESFFEYNDKKFLFIDLPGVYSLDSYTLEEKVSEKCIKEDNIDIIVNVVDAISLERNLYLTLQLIELGKPVVLALNMMDIAIKKGIKIDLDRLSYLLKIPVVFVCAKNKKGMDLILKKISDFTKLTKTSNPTYEYKNYSAKQRYELIKKITKNVYVKTKNQLNISDKVDAVFIHKFWGVPIFLFIMLIVFFGTFFLGDYLKLYIENGVDVFFEYIIKFVVKSGANYKICSLISDGIVPGIKGVISFLPNIFVLFTALAFLEDCGYMARIAYVMDNLMEKVGLSGKAFIPMILGFGCTVPSIMATKFLSNKGDRLKTILILPFMSCSARLTVYIMISSVFFGKHAMFVTFSLYIIGIVISILLLKIFNAFSKNLEGSLIIELPDYKIPDANTVFIYVFEKIKSYIFNAGTVIFISSIILWFLLNFNSNGFTQNNELCFGAYIGKIFIPIMKPIGLGYWQIIVSLISGVASKEIVISSMGILFNIHNISSKNGMAALNNILYQNGFNLVNAYSLLLFCLLYVPCIATVITIKKETGSLKYTLFSVLMHFILAWLICFLFYNAVSFF